MAENIAHLSLKHPPPSPAREPAPDAVAILAALPDAIFVIEPPGQVLLANLAAEQMLSASAAQIRERGLDYYLAADCALFALIEKASHTGATVAEHGLRLESPRIGSHLLSARVAPVADGVRQVVVALRPDSFAQSVDRRMQRRGAARSVSGMASMMAHEVKNPLAAIRGAAQLIETMLDPDERALARMIRDETDRVCRLVDRMELFSVDGSERREPVNIHEVLDRVRRAAQSGFARHIRFVESYDPSLPPAWADRDQLVQVFLNLVKNATEAAPEIGGEIALTTAYQLGLSVAERGKARLSLPLVVSVQDNGPGIPEDMRANLFDPFVTTKSGGSGLGLALVAKAVDDHGGIVEWESEPRRTVFRVMLPVAPAAESNRDHDHGR